MPDTQDVYIAEADGQGYDDAAHVESIMHFPDDEHLRLLYMDMIRREYLIEALEQRRFPTTITHDEFRLLTLHEDGHTLIDAKRLSDRKKNGFVAAVCLRYFIAARLHHPDASAGMLQKAAWERYFIEHFAPSLGQEQVEGRKSRKSGRQHKTKKGTTPLGSLPLDEKGLRRARIQFLPSAHLWAVAVGPCGHEMTYLRKPLSPAFLEYAEEFRLLADMLGAYSLADPKGEAKPPFRVRLAGPELERTINDEIRAEAAMAVSRTDGLHLPLPNTSPKVPRLTRRRHDPLRDAWDRTPSVTPAAARRAFSAEPTPEDPPQTIDAAEIAAKFSISPLPRSFLRHYIR